MPLHVCYVVSDVPGGVYADMAWIAATLLRRVHPDVHIDIVCDEQTHAWLDAPRSPGTLGNPGAPVRALADRVFKVITDEADAVRRSRIVKVSLRDAIDGDFLFMDIDALVFRPLDAITSLQGDLIAAYDRAYEAPEPHRALPHVQRDLDKLGWNAPDDGYFNAGVIYSRDNETSRAMWRLWKSRWFEYARATGKHYDQPSFNSVLREHRSHVGVLPITYNAIIEPCPWQARDAAVLHFLASWTYKSSRVVTLFDHLLEHYKLTGKIDDHMIAQCLASHHPWVGNGSVRRYLNTRRYIRAAMQVCKVAITRLQGREPEAPGRPSALSQP